MNCFRLFLAFIVSLSILYANLVGAEEKKSGIYSLDDIVVTATKSEKSILDAPGSIDVVTAEDIKRRNVKDVDEAVRMIPGVFDRRTKGFADISPSINIRGVYGSNRNLVLIDGQPVSADVWRRFPLELVERIEVAKGPFSSLYGSDAMGGVINIITKTPKDKLEMKINTGFETHNSQYYEVVGSGKVDKFSYSASARKRQTDGYESNLTVKSPRTTETKPTSGTEVTGAKRTTDRTGNERFLVGDTGDNYYDDLSFNFMTRWDFTSDTNIRIDYTRTDYEYGYEGDGSYLRDGSGNKISSGTVYFHDSKNNNWKQISNLTSTDFESTYGGNTIDLISVTGETKIRDIRFKGFFSFDKDDYWWVQPSLTSPYFQPSVNKKTRGELMAVVPLPFQQVLTIGADIKTMEYEKEQYDLSDWTRKRSKTNLTQEQRGKIRTFGLYFQDEIFKFDPLTIYLGGRYDHWESYDGYNYIVRSGTEKEYTFGKRSDDNFSSRLSLVYRLSEDSSVKASIGQAFRGPTTSELYSGWESVSSGGRGTSLPNENLKPEKILSGELSFEKSYAGWIFGKATYFYNHMTDYMYNKSFSDSERIAYNLKNYGDADYFNDIRQRQNIGKSRSHGVEFETRLQLFNYFEPFANITAMSTKVVENPSNPDSEGKKIPNIPETTFNAGIDYLFKGFSAGIVGRYVGKRYATDDNSDKKKRVFTAHDPFFVVDAKVSYSMEIAGFLPTISVTCDNMFDKEYYQYYLSPGRTWGVHLNVSRSF